MKKTLKWAVIAVIVLVMLALAAWIGWNAFDDTLDPRAAAYGAPRTVSMPAAENGHYAALGMSAPEGVDAIHHARAWFDERRAAARENRDEDRPLIEREPRPRLCDTTQVLCTVEAREKRDMLTAQLNAFREDLARYEKLLAYTRYEEVMDYELRNGMQLPPYGGVLDGQRAYLTRIALTMNAGRIEDALTMLGREMAARRLMLEGSHTLLGKMIATSLYLRGLAFAADLLQHKAAELKPHAARLAVMVQPLDRAALKLDRAFETEFAWLVLGIQDPMRVRSARLDDSPYLEVYGSTLFYKKNATRNTLYEIFSAMGAASLAPASHFPDAWRKVPAVPRFSEYGDFFDNPAGKMMMNIAMPSYDSFVRRIHDLDAFNRLVGLRIEMLAADVSAAGAQVFVEKSAARFYDPHSAKPVMWDAASKRLSVPVSEDTVKRKYIFIDKGRAFAQL